MSKYLVYDELNGERADAREFEAMTPQHAAEQYAEQDRDGHTDGIYRAPQPLMVEDVSSRRFRVRVMVEMEPRWCAYDTEVLGSQKSEAT